MTEEIQENPFSLSIGDLMAALLLLFVLILMGVLLQLQEQVEQQNNIVDKFDNLNEDLYKDLLIEFEGDLKDWNATIIDTTLSIRFEEPKLLFGNGKSNLKEPFKVILDEFFPRYLNVIRRPKYINEISEIRIEGHTSSLGSGSRDNNYIENLKLSQDRSRKTLEYLFGNKSMNKSIKSWCISRLTANGLSWSKLILKPGTDKEDPNKSRRVEFRVKIDAEKKLRDLSNMMKEKKTSN
jgi:outer membrane protein OmpA-like peptidoglycan-associated protein|tara:strand:+ start:1928 stop:2641 length:714 start_codon:yes stop_codon:yes gene_type:complete